MKMLIAGQWVDGLKHIDVENPYDQSVVDTVPRGTPEDVDRAIASAVEGAGIARQMPIHQRLEILYGTARIVRESQEEFARTIASEGSKTIHEARKEAGRCVNTLTVAAEEARRILGETLPFDSVPGGEQKIGYYYRMPVGVIGAITPFNDPLNLVAHKLGPAIAGGNSLVLKPATVTPLSALKLAHAFMDAGLPAHILNVVTGYASEIGEPLVTDPRVRMITFTGGPEAGEQIVRQAGLKKIGMELGSNSPVIVCADAALEWAVESCVAGAFWAAGQNCIGVQRILIEQPVYEAFRAQFVARARKIKVGPQLEAATEMGPMITLKEAERVAAWISEAVSAGANLLAGGGQEGTRVEPTVLEGVPPTTRLSCEEVFGPVVILQPFETLEDAIVRANDVDYGLHAAVFTQDVSKAFRTAYALDVGGVMINDSTDYRLDQMPFGGVKKSGLGREGIKFSLQEMTEPKVVCLQL
ncbi:MAG: aldehyde dehydrogenase family protein [Candidatus Eisenbacteria bacterium]|nr:aldehyde dehydrogenase family protein [Candidatus Eisenbacteria bacterium]